MAGQMMITFDDGLACHVAAADILNDLDIKGVFGIVTSRVNQLGFVTEDDLNNMKKQGHTICNHSAKHKWLGIGEPKPGKIRSTRDEITADYLEGKAWLEKRGYRGDFLLVPFGTTNIDGGGHLNELVCEFEWLRVTIGAPVKMEYGWWTPQGSKRLFSKNYNGEIIGVSCAADTRNPTRIIETIDTAINAGSMAVLAYHSICDVTGQAQNITLEQAMNDFEYMAEKIKSGELECVTPEQLIKTR